MKSLVKNIKTEVDQGHRLVHLDATRIVEFFENHKGLGA